MIKFVKMVINHYKFVIHIEKIKQKIFHILKNKYKGY